MPSGKAIRLEILSFSSITSRTDRSVLELIDSNYTFLNEPLAKFYGISGIKGNEMRRSADHGQPAVGVLTQASVLMVTSTQREPRR